MLFTWSVAENTGGSDTSLMVPLICIGVIALIAVLALVPLLVGSLRRHKSGEALLAMTALWAIVAIGVVVNTILEQNKWSSEKQTRVNSGYYDPKDNSEAPAWPLKSGGALGVGYVALLIWAATAKRKESPSFPVIMDNKH
jgi:hypothetical protein